MVKVNASAGGVVIDNVTAQNDLFGFALENSRTGLKQGINWTDCVFYRSKSKFLYVCLYLCISNVILSFSPW